MADFLFLCLFPYFCVFISSLLHVRLFILSFLQSAGRESPEVTCYCSSSRYRGFFAEESVSRGTHFQLNKFLD